MQPRLPFEVDDARVQFVRHRRARRYIIRILPDGTVRVTMPRSGVKREAEAFVRQSRAWIEKQQRLRREEPAVRLWADGSLVLVDGVEQRLSVRITADGLRIRCGDVTVPMPSRAARTREPSSARTGGPPSGGPVDIAAVVQRWLRARAADELPGVLQAYARQFGLTVTRVSVRDQRARWGSCSRRGSITLNWRLVQMPVWVRDYIIVHELMHRREMNHSPRFWRHVAAAYPRHLEARQWLRTEGKKLL